VLEERAVKCLLDGLARKTRQDILGTSELVTLVRGEILSQPGTRRRYVYFPTDSISSLRARAGDKEFLDVASIGSETMLALPQLRGGWPLCVQVAQSGQAWRMTTVHFDRAVAKNTGLKDLLEPGLCALLRQITQIAVCTCFHDLDARLARQLLMTSRSSGTANFYLTHTLLAESLGSAAAA